MEIVSEILKYCDILDNEFGLDRLREIADAEGLLTYKNKNDKKLLCSVLATRYSLDRDTKFSDLDIEMQRIALSYLPKKEEISVAKELNIDLTQSYSPELYLNSEIEDVNTILKNLKYTHPQLRSLTIINGDGNLNFREARFSDSLRRLNLDGNKIEDLDLEDKTPNLTNLNLGSNNIRNLKLPSSITNLNLYDNNLGQKNLIFPPYLTMLNLRHNNLGDEGVASLNLPSSLKILDLSQNGITDVSSLNLPSSLTKLYLNRNQLGDEGVRNLRELNEMYPDLNIYT